MSESAKLSSSQQDGYDSINAFASADPLESQKKGKTLPHMGGNSVLVTAGILIGDTIGAGLLSMSAAVAMFGWLLGGVMICAMMALNTHLCMLLWRMQMHFPEVHTMGQLAVATFGRASKWQQALIGSFTDVVQYVFIFFMLAADSTGFGKGLGMLFYDVHICLPFWVVIGLAILFPVHARTQSLGSCKGLILFNCIVILGAVIIPLRYFIAQGAASTRPMGSVVQPVESMSLMGVLSGLNIMTFNFTIQFMTVEITAEMQKPGQFPRAMWGLAYPIICILFLAAGIGGYYYLGDEVHGLIINSLPFATSLRLSALCLVVFVLVTFLLKSIVLCKAIHIACDPENAGTTSTRSSSVWAAIVLGIMALSWLVAQTVPFFTPLIDLIGSTLAPLCCMVIPIVMYVQWYRTYAKRGSMSFVDKAEWVLIAVELILSLVILTVGTYDSVSTILAGWHSHGAPFACHCEHLWNTCQCSAKDPGMEFCLTPGSHRWDKAHPFGEVQYTPTPAEKMWWF